MNSKDVLVAARDLIAKGWTQSTSARDNRGIRVDLDGDEATCFCAYGAVARIAGRNNVLLQQVLDILTPLTAGYGIVYFNDGVGRTQQDVIDLFNKGIEYCGQQDTSVPSLP